MSDRNKKKIVNDPVHGFINISFPLSFDIIEHPFFQRLRYIRQLGLTFLVYPGATHTRFQHALGAMHLMASAISVLRAKGHIITNQEAEAATAAILLHDIGHGPFSHSLEFHLVKGISHEQIGRHLVHEMTTQFGNRLDMAVAILEDQYPKRFLHQLVSGQLDVDRMDYLRRDSFFTGVTEGTIGSERIIKMLNVVDDNLVVEAKGIYSIEKFLIARRLMYWQVYLHKTVVAAEQMLIQLFLRARQLTQTGEQLFGSPALSYFLAHDVIESDFAKPMAELSALYHFSNFDDSDLLVAAKQWRFHPDRVLSSLAQMLVARKLFKVELRNTPFSEEEVEQKLAMLKHISPELAAHSSYFVIADSVSNNAYRLNEESIKILYNTGELVDIALASDMLNAKILSKDITKHFLCYLNSNGFKS